MDYSNHVEVVKRALELEKKKDNLNSLIQRKKQEQFAKSMPQAPTCKQAKYQEPPINHNVQINKLLMFLPMLVFIVWPLIYYFYIYENEKKKAVERIRNSEWYRQQCALAKSEADRQQQAYNAEYSVAKNYYDTTVLPQFKAELKQWQDRHEKVIAAAEQELAQCENELTEIYQNSRMIPMQYQNSYALQHIYDTVSSSDYDIKQAIESFEKYEQRRLNEELIKQQRAANDLAAEQLYQQQEANDLRAEANDIADRARREANRAAFVNAVQQHNFNKTFKKYTDSRKKR